MITNLESGELAAQLYQYCNQQNIQVPILISRFLTKLFIQREASLALGTPEPLFNEMDHLNKLELFVIEPTEDGLDTEIKGLRQSLTHRIPAVEEVVDPGYYVEIKGRFLGNVIGISASEDFVFPVEKESHEEIKKLTSGPFIGTGLYFLSSYLKSSDVHYNTTVTFSEGSKLNLIAQKPIKRGDVIFVKA